MGWREARDDGRVKEGCPQGGVDLFSQLTPEGASAGAGIRSSRRASNRLGTVSGAGAVSVGSPVAAVTRSRTPEPPKRGKRRWRFEPKTITSAPHS